MTELKARPFLKWAGGKTQLITEVTKLIPNKFTTQNFTYIEPFVGSGAVLFWIINSFTTLKRVVINDINEDLINTYRTIANRPEELISILGSYQSDFHSMEGDEEAKSNYYYAKRELYNKRILKETEQSALFIFLNRTCFNGLYRVNKKNEFNVPIGRYKRPMICDKENITAVSKALQNVEILSGDYQQTLQYAEDLTLFYFDPPYKPLNRTSSFNSYAKEEFDDNEQIRLRDFCHKLDKLNYYWILSNSDVKSIDNNNLFFDDLYSDFIIKRVTANRNINANSLKRGKLKELLITNHIKV